MGIHIVNLHYYKPVPGEILIKVDRSSILGNPFRMHDKSERDMVCDKYENYFNHKINNSFNFDRALRDIYNTSLVADIALGCWCAPRRCHAETILRYIKSQDLYTL